MTNFDYIKNLGIDELYRYCAAAEEFQASNPDISAVNARRALEYIVRELYQMKRIALPERVSLFELVEGEPFKEFIGSDRVMMAVHYVRKEAIRKFGDFISGAELNAEQEDSLMTIVSYVCENGDITGEIVVNEAPFDERLGVFTALMIPLRNYVDNMHKVILPPGYAARSCAAS